MTERTDERVGEVAAKYDRFYRQPNYFHYRRWLYRPFIRALIKEARLRPGSRVLDVGCGQGFFTSLFAEEGMDSLGTDISAEGVAQARTSHGISGAKFEVCDALQLSCASAFDCAYTRSCSLYNRPDFADHRELTGKLLEYLRPGGVLIFDYYTKLNLCARKKSSSWRYHSLEEARRHFSAYTGSKVFFSLRFDTLLLGRHAFALGGLSALASRILNQGGELIAMVRKA